MLILRRVAGLALLAALVLAARLANAEPVSTTVTFDFGDAVAAAVEGAISGDGKILSFKGIPYAMAPLGKWRWRRPQPIKWSGVRPAQEFGAECMQMKDEGDPRELKEDCLFLNVWRPAEKGSGEPFPVMVWIHGGGYVIGGSSGISAISGPITDGSALAAQGLVVVTLNYRLGRLGFFAHRALIKANEDQGEDSDHRGYSGNFGYMDQIYALKWVKANIGKFGGNPDQVTIVGESAGGASVLHLLTSTETKHLFHRVIVMSGGGRRAMLVLGKKMIADNPEKLSPEKPSQEQIDACFSMICRIDPKAPDALAQLRALDANTLVADLDFTSATLVEIIKAMPAFAGTPMIDDWIVKGEPEEMLLNRKAAAVPIIIGTVAAEPALYFPPRKAPYPYAYFGDKKEQQDAARAKYGGSPSIAAVAVGIDMSMHEPARFVARAMTAAGNPAWLYRFSYVVESAVVDSFADPVYAGAAHSTEVPFLFQTLDYRYGEDKVSNQDRQVARDFSGYFANFAIAKNPDPNFGDRPTKWQKFEQTDPPQLMNFTFTVIGLPLGPHAIRSLIQFGDDPIKDRIELVGSVARQP